MWYHMIFYRTYRRILRATFSGIQDVATTGECEKKRGKNLLSWRQKLPYFARESIGRAKKGYRNEVFICARSLFSPTRAEKSAF